MFGGKIGQLVDILGGLEAFVTTAALFFAQRLPHLQRFDIVGNLLALVHELGIGRNQANQHLAAHRLLARFRLRIAGKQRHNVVIINDGRGKEHKFKIQLLYCQASAIVTVVLLVLQALGGFQIDAAEGLQLLLGEYLFNAGFVFRRQVGITGRVGS